MAIGISATLALAAVVVQIAWQPSIVVFVAMVAGVGALVNATVQKPMLFGYAGRHRGPTAMAIDAMGGALGGCLGPLVMGAVLGIGGAALAYASLAIIPALALVLLRRIGGPPLTPAENPLANLSPTVGIQKPALGAVLGVTSLFNLFYFPFLALIPVLAKDLVSSALAVGILGAMPGLGMVVTNLVITFVQPKRLGRIYYVGPLVALVSLVLVGTLDSFVGVVVALFVAGCGAGGFSAMQSVMVLLTVETKDQELSMGKLSTAVGCLPVGTMMLGVAGQAFGAATTISLSGAMGFVALAIWWMRYRVVVDVRAPSFPTAATVDRRVVM